MSTNTRPVNAPIAKCLTLLLGWMLVGSVGQAQFHAPILEHKFAWDYPDLWVGELNVTRFEIRVDGGPSSSVGMSILSREAQSYSTPLPDMPIGQHLLEVRACGPTMCGAWSEPMLFVFSPPFVVEVQRFGWPGH